MIEAILGKSRFLVVDEAQRIPDVGLRLKLIIGQVPDVQVVVTGSSSFEPAARVGETQTGRKRIFRMFPLTYSEMVAHTIWENFVISERMKQHFVQGDFVNTWFWRTQQQKEIDLIEEADDFLLTGS